MKIYAGNLAFGVDDAALRAAFEPHGEVTSAQVVMDRDSGRSRGFGFVEMPTPDQAQAAIQALNGTDLQGRSLNISEARSKSEGGSRGGDRGGDRGSRRPSW
ncbi:MAG TPA: RNA-binding protein [Planctomycetota bacterium]|nr:RNA-binding protein [Planctomycetota bacterium]